MNPDYFKGLRECCQSDAAFEQMQKILLAIEVERQKSELAYICQSLFGDRPPEAVVSAEPDEYQETVKNLITQRTTDLLTSNERLRQEISDRRWAEQALQESERLFRSLIENATDVIAILDQQGVFRYCSPSTKRILGYSYEEVVGHSALEFVHPSDAPQVMQVLQTAVQNPHLSQPPLEYRVQHKNGSWCFFEAVTTSLLNEPSIHGVVINCHDITERKQAEAELLEMSTALGNAVEGIARVNRQGYYITLNPAYAVSLGYQLEEMIGTRWLEAVHPDDRPIVIAAHKQLQAEGKAQVEVRALRKDGSVFHEEMVMVAAYDWQNQIVGHHCFTRDITERKQAEEALRQQAEWERLMLGIAQRIRNSLDLQEILNTTVSEIRQFLKADRVVIFRLYPNGRGLTTAESVEEGWNSMLGVQLTEDWFKQSQTRYRLGKNLIVDDLQAQCTSSAKSFLANFHIRALMVVPILHEQQLWGTLAVHQCQSVRHWEPSEINLLEQLSTQLAIAIQQSELYRQVQQLNTHLEQQVQERTAELEKALQFEALLKRITDAVRDSLDENRILQTAVQELALGLEISGCDSALYNLEEQTSTICYEYICSDLKPARGSTIKWEPAKELFNQLLQEQCFQFCQLIPDKARPDARNFTLMACPLVDDQGVVGDLWLFKSNTQSFSNAEIRLVQQVANQCAIAIRQARLFQAAQAQVAALEELNQLKDDFLSTVSHELRTPMSNMKMAIHMLQNATSPERQQRYLEILQSECVREIELINDLLDLQRLEASSYPVSLQPLELGGWLTQVVEPFYSRASDRQQHLSVDVPTSLPYLVTDKAALERILAELLNNACKYTPPGGEVSLQVSLQLTGGLSRIVFQVQNEAEIDPLELPRIFEKFYRIPNADPWKQGGTGLGLALVQRLVSQLKGELQAESSNGWTTFTVALESGDYSE
jgi:PAS domain S-box-containing protein